MAGAGEEQDLWEGETEHQETIRKKKEAIDESRTLCAGCLPLVLILSAPQVLIQATLQVSLRDWSICPAMWQGAWVCSCSNATLFSPSHRAGLLYSTEGGTPATLSLPSSLALLSRKQSGVARGALALESGNMGRGLLPQMGCTTLNSPFSFLRLNLSL